MSAITLCADRALNLNIQRKLRILSEDLFKSLDGNITSLISFSQSWSNFNNTVNSYHDKLQIDTLHMVSAFAATVGVITSSLLEVQTESDAVLQELTSDIDQILDEGMGHLTLKDNKNNQRHSALQTQYPSYIKLSYGWLLENLHNPYPSKDTRASIAHRSDAPDKDVDSWFVDARKRIGWNALRKDRFSNKRVDIVNAASRFFLIPDPKRPLDPNLELNFATIESRAKDLYSEKFLESALATKLDVAVKDMTPDLKALAKVEEKRRRQFERRRREKRTREEFSYPSPEHSPGTSPEPSLSTLSDQTDSSCCMRHPSSSSALEESFPERPAKRRRSESQIVSHDSAAKSLPSPAISVIEVSDDSSTLLLPMPSVVSPNLKRKRRLSDADGHAPKRPHNLQIRPRPQAASDPFPMPLAVSSFDDWYSNNFITEEVVQCDIPPAVSVEAPDATAPLDIEIYNFSCNNHETIPTTDLSLSASASSHVDKVATRECLYSEDNSFSWFDLYNYGFPCSVHEQATIPPFGSDLTPALDYASAGGAVSVHSPPIMEWDPPTGSTSQGPLLQQNDFLNKSIPTPELFGDPNAIAKSSDPTLLDLSSQPRKEAKQWELLAVQERLIALHAELAATP